jgi:hypothetical protein
MLKTKTVTGNLPKTILQGSSRAEVLRRLIDERNFVECVGFRLALPNLQILAVSQFQLSSLEAGALAAHHPLQMKETLKRR